VSESKKKYDSTNSIDVKNLLKIFKGKRGMEDVRAVDGISFHIEKGEVFGLLVGVYILKYLLYHSLVVLQIISNNLF
jgi:hypothetical protein